MNASEIIGQIPGLTQDKLTYFVRAGYVRPRKVKRGSLLYNEFSDADLEIIRRAWGHIQTWDMKTRSAFKRARAEHQNSQAQLL